MSRLLYTALAVCIFSLSASVARSQELSDSQIKKNIMPISGSLDQINSLKPKVYEYNTSQYSHLKLPAGGHYGFITEEFQQVFPGLVYKKPQSFMAGKNLFRNATIKQIHLEGLIPVLIASIQEQQAAIEALRAEVEALKKK